MSTLDEKLAVMQAAKDGKTIEFKRKLTNSGWAVIVAPGWDWQSFEYRVKREPRTFYINEYPDNEYGVIGYAYPTKESARMDAGVPPARRAVKYVEVLED